MLQIRVRQSWQAVLLLVLAVELLDLEIQLAYSSWNIRSWQHITLPIMHMRVEYVANDVGRNPMVVQHVEEIESEREDAEPGMSHQWVMGSTEICQEGHVVFDAPSPCSSITKVIVWMAAGVCHTVSTAIIAVEMRHAEDVADVFHVGTDEHQNTSP